MKTINSHPVTLMLDEEYFKKFTFITTNKHQD